MGNPRLAWLIAAALVAGMTLVPAPAVAEHSVSELISTGPGPDGGETVFSFHVSPDGERVLFGTSSALVPEDTDNCDEPEFEFFRPCYDGYERFGGTTSLVTTGPTDTKAAIDIHFTAASRDGTRAFFNTTQALVPEDTDIATDAYERTAGVTSLVSVGTDGQATGGGILTGISEDGTRAFFWTSARLVPEDDDECVDFYERSAGTTKLISTGVPPAPGQFLNCASLSWVGASADGSRVFLHSPAQVTAQDTDADRDIYEWSGGDASLVTTGPADGPEGGILDTDVVISRDGAHVYFRTMEDLVAEDTDGSSFPEDQDLYERFNGTTRLVVPPVPGNSSPRGFLSGMSDDASRIFFSTSAGLVPEDTNGGSDTYERFGGELRLVTTGPLGSPGGASIAGPDAGGGTRDGVSPDGRSVVFASSNPFVPEDTDNVQDIYLRANGETRLVSTGPADEHADEPVRSDLVRLTPDGSRVFTTTAARFVADDVDTLIDVYEWHAGRTTLVPHGVPTSDHVHLDPRAEVDDGSRVFITTGAQLTPGDTDAASDLYAVDLANAPPDCQAVAANPNVLPRANGRLVPIALTGATDPDGDAVSLEIIGVTQDEPTGRSRDAVLNSAGDEVRLRAERDNRGDGRVYRIEFEASDGNGGTCSGTAKVAVPRKKNKAAVDSAPPSYDSFG